MHRQPRPASSTRRRAVRARGSVTAVSALVLGLLSTGVALPLSAAADPVPDPAADTFSPTGTPFSEEVPDGACFVDATVAGGAGGRSASGAGGLGANGAGAKIKARFAVAPGTTFGGTVGGGGGMHSSKTGGVGGVNGGGAGGSAKTDHAGAGGGGFSSLSLGGDVVVVAGGGGGSGGGHSTTSAGFGGAAGLPTDLARTAAGTAGTDGRDRNGVTAGGGQGGGTTTTEPGGAGGVHSTTPTLNGGAGAARAGGAGVEDPNYDAAGGGGGGYFGGGAGAATLIQNDDDGLKDVAGGGGGGGSSFVAATATDVSAEPHGRKTGTGVGDSGSITLTWVPCTYDLDVTKTVAVTPTATTGIAPVGSTLTWTVEVTNTSKVAMTRGDTVTLTDTLPGAGAKILTSYATSGGTSSTFERGTVTCGTAIDAPIPGTLTCSRPYALLGGSADGVRGLDAGETLTVTYTQEVTDPHGTVLANTASVTDRTAGDDTDSSTATVTVAAPPTARHDEDLRNKIGETVTVPVLTNDTPELADFDVELRDPATSAWVTELEVPHEGTWTVDEGVVAMSASASAASGATVTFVPEPGFLVDPTPVTYRITDENGLTATAEITVTYVPVAANDTSAPSEIGTEVRVYVLTNDTGSFDHTTLRLVDGGGTATSLVVPGEGTWAVSTDDAYVSFTPEPGFLADPTPVAYRITDTTGDVVDALVEVDYLPEASSDDALGNTLGTAVTVDVLANDTGVMVPSTVGLEDPSGALVLTLGVVGEGVWTVNATTGAVTFTPEPGFVANPRPVHYQVQDTSGDLTNRAAITVTYQPEADPDSRAGNALGSTVTVDVLGNDAGDLDRTSVQLLNSASTRVTRLVVAGEGTWTVDPTTGSITFAPAAGFVGNPTSVDYEVSDVDGGTARSTVSVTYLPEADPDIKAGNVLGTTVTVDILGNDTGDFVASSVRLVGPNGARVTRLTVAGQGVWTVSSTTGAATFAPEAGFVGNPTPVDYEVLNTAGDAATSRVGVTYLPEADPDIKAGNVLGTTVTVDILGNDAGDLDPTSVRLVGPNGARVTRLMVAGQGVWTVGSSTGAVSFAPAAGFVGNPTAVPYEVSSVSGDTVRSSVAVAYVPEASDDSSEGNAPGAAVTVPTVGNDDGDLDPTTVRLVGPGGALVTTLVVAGQGTWLVDPTTGAISFAPVAGFTGNPTAVTYQVTDQAGSTTTAQVQIAYAAGPIAAAAATVRNALAVTGFSPVAGGAAALTLVLAGVGALLVARRRAVR